MICHSMGYVYCFCQIFQGLRLFKGVRLFRSLEYIASQDAGNPNEVYVEF